MKIIKLLIIIVFLIGVSLAVVNFSNIASKAKKDLDQERFLRLSSEEKLNKAKIKIESLKDKVSKSENKINVLAKQLEQKNIMNKNLEMRLDKAIKIKETIEKKLTDIESMVNAGEPFSANQ